MALLLRLALLTRKDQTNRPVLLGGRQGLSVSSSTLRICLVWLPVLICLCLISDESTDTFSAARTSGWIRHLAEFLFGPIRQPVWDLAHHVVRKTGHFVGYGLVGLCWFRAWLLTWRRALLRSTALLWRRTSAIMALLCTLLVATLDELHQTYIPSRTGLMSDAWLDTAGAAIGMGVVACFWFAQRPGWPARQHS